jgi:5-formyltetrahydrofolate cyclo-ligase
LESASKTNTCARSVGLVATDKVALRSALLAKRRGLDSASKTHWDALIGAQILTWSRTHGVRSLGVYWPIQGEPDLRAAYQELVKHGVRLALPVVVGADAPLQFAAWVPGEALVRDAMGVCIPAEARFEFTPEAILVPCLGFNAAGFRLGYGGGFYDRTLAGTPRPLAIGIGYGCLAAQFEHAPHDIAMDLMLTEAAPRP